MNAQRRAAVGIALVVGLLIGAPTASAGPGIVDEQVDGNVLTARVRILGIDLVDLRIEFEEVEGLEPGALGLSADLLDILELAALLGRLPDLLLTTIPTELLLVLHLDPDPGVSFRGAAWLTLKTDLLPYIPGTRLRIFHASGLGPFEDVTAETGAGSYRGGAMRPDLYTSTYIIAIDLRSEQTVADRKLDRIEALLAARSGVIDPAVQAGLESRLAAVRTAFESGAHVNAVAALDGFAQAVIQASGSDIPDVWDSESSAPNVAGELRSQAATARFTLLQMAGGGGGFAGLAPASAGGPEAPGGPGTPGGPLGAGPGSGGPPFGVGGSPGAGGPAGGGG